MNLLPLHGCAKRREDAWSSRACSPEIRSNGSFAVRIQPVDATSIALDLATDGGRRSPKEHAIA